MRDSSKKSFLLLPENRNVGTSHGETILEALLREKIEINHSCGGMGTCGTCRIILIKNIDKISPPTELELDMAIDRGFLENERLACQSCAGDKLQIKKPN